MNYKHNYIYRVYKFVNLKMHEVYKFVHLKCISGVQICTTCFKLMKLY